MRFSFAPEEVIGRQTKRPEMMRRAVLLSIAVSAVVSLAWTSSAFAQNEKAVTIEKKVRKIEEKGAFLGIYMADLDKEMISRSDYPRSTGVLVTGIVEDLSLIHI